MKYFILPFLIIATLLTGCKKDKASPQSIVGKWELRNILGAQVPGTPSTYKAGNGNIIEFTANGFQNIQNGKVTSNRTYVIVNALADIDGNSYSQALIYDNEQTKWYFKISGDKLIMSVGPIASDGVTLTYQWIK
jgi:hypothetical protein